MSDLLAGQMEPTFRAVSDTPYACCQLVNRMLKDYAVVAWNWSVIEGKLMLTALMVSQREIRKAQLAAMGPAPTMQRQ